MPTNPGEPNSHRAKKYAAVIHGAQRYNDEVPYTDHLEMVADVLYRHGLGVDHALVSAAYLHDAIEDTGTSYTDILARFGEEVAELVFAVTSELGRNRKERNAKTYPKIAEDPRAILLKLADRIANVEYGLATPGGKTQMYVDEYPAFRKALHPSTSVLRPRRCDACEGAGRLDPGMFDDVPVRDGVSGVQCSRCEGTTQIFESTNEPVGMHAAEERMWDLLDRLLIAK